MSRTNSTSSGSPPSGIASRLLSSHGTSLGDFPMLNRSNSWRSHASRSTRGHTTRQGSVSSSEHSHTSYQTSLNTDKDLPTPPIKVDEEEEYYELTPSGSTPSIIRVHYQKRTAIIFLPKDYKGLKWVTKKVFGLPDTYDLLFSAKIREFGEKSVEIDTEVWTVIKSRITQVWANEHPDSLVEVTMIRWGATDPDLVKPRLSKWMTGTELMTLYPGKFLYRYIEGAKKWKLYQNNDKLMDYCVNRAATICHSTQEIPPNNVLAKRTSTSGSTYGSVRGSMYSLV